MKDIFLVLLVLAACISNATSQIVESSTGTFSYRISGTIVDETLRLMTNIPVCLISIERPNSGSSTCTKTDANGAFVFETKDTPGKYRVAATTGRDVFLVDSRESTDRRDVATDIDLEAQGVSRIITLHFDSIAESQAKAELSLRKDPLSYAIFRGDITAVKDLIAKGADVNSTGGMFGSNLLTAIYTYRIDILPVLIAGRADINATGGDDRSPLREASYLSQRTAVKVLLDAGARLEDKDKLGRTALILAAERRDPEVVKLLISAGADINASDGLGRTPLMIAALVGQIDNLRYLIKSGADVFAKDKAGKTTINYATERKTKAEAIGVIKILNAAGVVE